MIVFFALRNRISNCLLLIAEIMTETGYQIHIQLTRQINNSLSEYRWIKRFS